MKIKLPILSLTMFVAVHSVALDLGIKPMPTAYDRGLDYLASVQNADGSWGTPAGQVYETGFAALAFLNYGEIPTSNEYGENVKQGLRWLIRQNPTNTQEQVVLIHTLAVAHEFTRIPILREVAASHSREINPDELQDEWALFYKITMLQDSNPASREANTLALRGFSVDANGASPLSLYLQTLAMFMKGRDVWMEYNQKTLVPLIKRQATDGSFSLEQGSNQIESTAFALLQISVYYGYWRAYLNINYSDCEAFSQEQVIEINMD